MILPCSAKDNEVVQVTTDSLHTGSEIVHQALEGAGALCNLKGLNVKLNSPVAVMKAVMGLERSVSWI